MLTSEAYQAASAQQRSTLLSLEQEEPQTLEPHSPKRLARSRRKQPAYDRVKDILCRFARAIEEEDHYE